MHKTLLCSSLLVAVALLSGCGNSHPLPPSSGNAAAASATGAASVYQPTAGLFALTTDAQLAQPAAATDKCNLDAIDGAPVGSRLLSHNVASLFAGWAANGNGTDVPASVEVVLSSTRKAQVAGGGAVKGTQAYGMQVATGAPRPDVAAANHAPALAKAGFAVNASMSDVAPGTYTVEFRYSASGKSWVCKTKSTVTVQ